MKLRIFFSLAVAAIAATAFAQGGYQDGVDNYNAGRLDIAKMILNNTINDPSTNKAEAYYYLGLLDVAESDIIAAKENFNRGLAENPSYPYNMIGLGELALKAGDVKGAETLFKQAQAVNKKDTKVIAEVGRAYWNVDPVKYAKEIKKQIDKALKDSKNTEPAVYVLQGDMVAKENPGEAAGLYEMAITQADGKGTVNREAYVKYANTYIRVNPSYAIGKLEELNQREPNSALAQRELAEKYYDNSQFGRACLQYGKLIENPNHFQVDEQRYAGLLYSAKEYDKSLDMAYKVLAADPDNFYMYRVLMLDKAALEDWTGAEEAGTKLFNAPGVNLVANDYVVYGEVLARLGKSEDAVAVFEKAIELNPDKPELMTKLSEVYEGAGQSEKAVEILKQYLDMGNGTVNDIFNMARRYQSLARTLEKGTPERTAAAQEGLKYINMALERVPENPSVLNTKAQILFVLNDDKPAADVATAYQDLINVLDKTDDAKTKYASYYTAAYYLIGVYYLDSDKAKAKEYLSKYLELHPDDETVKQLIEE